MIWESINTIKSAYNRYVKPVCDEYNLSRIEFDIIMSLANNPQYNTAAEICKMRNFTKSHVSAALTALESRGYVHKFYTDHNHKTLRLKLTEQAANIVVDGQSAQESFVAQITRGLDSKDLARFKSYMETVDRNAHAANMEE